MEFLESRRSWENQRPPDIRQKSGLFWASPFTMHLVCTLLIFLWSFRDFPASFGPWQIFRTLKEMASPCTANPYPDYAPINYSLADCVNSSPPLILRKFRGFGGIWAISGKFEKFRENFRGTQWNSVGLCMALTILFEILTFLIRKPFFLCNCNCNFQKIIPRTIFYVTVPNSNCREIFQSDPQNCNCNGN